MQTESLLSSYWVYPLILFAYYWLELIETRKAARKHTEYPLAGTWSSLTPRVVLNLIFAANAARVLEEGYRKVTRASFSLFCHVLTAGKFKDKAFQLIRNDGSIVVLPTCLLDELSHLPSTIASPHGALEHDLLGPYTGLNLILESRLHHSIVQRKLTPRLGLLTPGLENELLLAFEEYFPACDYWTEFQPYQVFGKVSARLSARALVGPSLCCDPTWLDISVNYTESCECFSHSLPILVEPTNGRLSVPHNCNLALISVLDASSDLLRPPFLLVWPAVCAEGEGAPWSSYSQSSSQK